MLEIKNDKRAIIKTATNLAGTFKDCFSADTTEKWIRHFAQYRLDMIEQLELENYDIKYSKKNKKLFIDTFTDITLQNIEAKKKARANKEKIDIKKHGVKRKPQKGNK